MEITVFARYYPLAAKAYTGPFIQINTGVVFFSRAHIAFPPADVIGFSTGIAAGWRFPMGKRWYIEPSVRAGYPYIAGAGVAFAYRM